MSDQNQNNTIYEWNDTSIKLASSSYDPSGGPPANAQVLPRLSLLQGYTPAHIRDAWTSLGQLEVNDNTRVYTRFSIFRVVQPTPSTPLNGAVVFCDADYQVPTSFQWENMIMATGLATAQPLTVTSGQLMDKTSLIINPHFTVLLTQADFQGITASYDSTFIPFTEANANDLVAISDIDLNF